MREDVSEKILQITEALLAKILREKKPAFVIKTHSATFCGGSFKGNTISALLDKSVCVDNAVTNLLQNHQPTPTWHSAKVHLSVSRQVNLGTLKSSRFSKIFNFDREHFLSPNIIAENPESRFKYDMSENNE